MLSYSAFSFFAIMFIIEEVFSGCRLLRASGPGGWQIAVSFGPSTF